MAKGQTNQDWWWAMLLYRTVVSGFVIGISLFLSGCSTPLKERLIGAWSGSANKPGVEAAQSIDSEIEFVFLDEGKCSIGLTFDHELFSGIPTQPCRWTLTDNLMMVEVDATGEPLVFNFSVEKTDGMLRLTDTKGDTLELERNERFD